MKLWAGLLIIIFSFSYWHLSYILRLSRFSKEELKIVSSPFECWRGLWTAILLSPLIPIYIYVENSALLVLFSATLPILVALLLGWWTNKYSISAILLQSANGACMALLLFTQRLSFVQLCIDKAVSLPVDQRLPVLAYCSEITRFWFNIWMTMALALVTVFGGAFISIFLFNTGNLGPKFTKKIALEERKVLAILFSVSIIWLLIAGFAWVGVKAIEYLSILADLQKMLAIPN